MPSISTTDAQGLYTKKLIDVYAERPKPTGFLRSFFPADISPTLELSIEVQRGTEKVAVDVVRGTEGSRAQSTRSTEKIFIPPYYRLWYDVTQLQLYDRLFGATEISDALFSRLVNNMADELVRLQDMIERSVELQCSQVLETGIVTVDKGINIDFKRKAGSLVDPGAGQYWATAGVDPYEDLEAGCNFLRQVGKAQGDVFNLILGSTALSDLLKNTVFLERQKLYDLKLDAVAAPQRQALGMSLHGELSAGPYRVRLWSYPQFYDNAAGTSTPYINPKKVVMIPESPRFKTGFAAVPQILESGELPQIGAFIFSEKIDKWEKVHKQSVESAPLAIPTAIDTIWTFQAVA
jgi:hypothetical protein